VPFFGKKAQKHEACQGFASCFAALPQSASWREAPLHVPTARFIYHFPRFALTDEALRRIASQYEAAPLPLRNEALSLPRARLML